MKYTSQTIRAVMEEISAGKIFLPAIQRKFVWGHQEIEALFDSIMRDYPIGTFLFWFVKGDTKNDYTFYQFLLDYNEKTNAVNKVAPKPYLGDSFVGVLDGQQRLNSMYVALQGSYAYKRKHASWHKEASFPERWLYLNLFYERPEEEENGLEYQFQFLTREEAAGVGPGTYWFEVKNALGWKDLTQAVQVMTEAALRHPDYGVKLLQQGVPMLTRLWQRLCSDEVISHFPVHEQDLDHIVDIFIRVNSTGVPLNKTDLLFSSIVAHWDNGRAKIEHAIASLNKKGSGFAFNNDFVMRCCLALTDVPVQLKVNSFRKANIEQIRDHWPKIRAAMEGAVDLLVEWGFSRETLATQNAVVPIAYFIFKGGDVSASKGALRQYLVRALLNQIFRSKTDRVVDAIREQLRELLPEGGYALRSSVLSVGNLLRMKLTDDRSLRIGEAEIDGFLDAKKGPYTFIILSLLYPHLKFDQVQFHQDHIHPWSQFTESRLKRLGLDAETIARWREDRDRLPNLQLMEGAQNKSKNDTPFAHWIHTLNGDTEYFLKTNFIPPHVGHDLIGFDRFYAERRQILRGRLQEALMS